MKFLLKYKKWILVILFVLPLLFSLYVQYDENINKYDYWNYQVLKELDLATQEEIKSLNTKDAIAKFKDDKKEIIRKFLPTSEQYRNFGCYKKFNTNTDESMDIIINSLGVYQFGKINDECFTNQSKQILFVSYLFVYFAIFFTIIILFTDKIRRLIHYKNHSVVIGLNNNSRELISNLIAKKENIKIYNSDNTNKYINELENSGEIIITGKLEYTIESNDYEIINAKEIFIINDSDAESLSNLSLLLNKFNNSKNREIKDKTKIYIEIKNRENKALFDKKGIYNKLITDYYEIYPFSINEIIVQEMFKDRSLVSNIKKIESGYVENLKILIVGFNDLSEEILYNILKLGHFDLNKITEVTVIDNNYELLNCKYKTIIERGKKPYENSNESLWKVKFSPYKSLYENADFNRIILCDKELDNGIDILNYMNNNYHVQIREKNTIIQVFNEHKNINDTINRDKNNFKNFSTFGDIETTVTLDNIKNNNLYKVAEYTNDFKETDESKKWINIDSFTRESNITEKLHMNVKLDLFNLVIKESKKIDKSKDIDLLMEEYISNSKHYLETLINNDTDLINISKLNYIFDNFSKKFNEEKFDLFCINNNNLKESLENIELENISKNYLEENKSRKIKDLFKIIDWESNPTYIQRKKLKLFFNNLNTICGQEEIKNHIVCNEEKIKKHYEDLLKYFEGYDKNYKNDIIDINSDEFKKMNENYKLELKKQGLKTREDFINYFESISNIDKDSREAFEKLGEYGNYKIKLNEEQISSIDKLYKEISDYRVNYEFMELENKKIKLNICILLSSIELFYKIKSNKIENINEYIDYLAELEHKRWNAYHILNGWKRRKIKEKDMIKKEHFDLCDWETLKEDDPYVVKYDYKNIYQIPFVAYCLGFEIMKIEEEGI
ncbi:hypothetical protein [Aliarcobacter cryaerophilus]|uniref:Ryanodine receptor Ryr domain-containing protein n=1 Tax=Aliarcobacter cryaerophilus TaxID=28198 RepID=A0A2S9TMS6_9BACT|nr:hypothetical protein [Aliarcobacter cryaerophilus]PRN00132.1 hypothetical protein CJ668_07705 [Arcobacter cryaerophilus gv. pseudocryaerophilus]